MPATYLLDTHVPIEVGVSGGFQAMPARVRRILEDPQTELLLSVVSEVEIAIKNGIQKLALSKDELSLICTNAGIASYPLRQRHTAQLFDLPMHHKDPFDRMIIATALSDGLPIISRDRQFRKYKGLRVIWL